MKILIIGGSGVLSSDILEECLKNGHTIYALNRGRSRKIMPKGVIPIVADIRELENFIDKLDNIGFDVIIDFLSLKVEHIKKTYSLLSAFCNQYIFISSACVFRRSPEDGVITEDSLKPNANLTYSREKYECEKWIIQNSRHYACHYTIVRPYITYGDTRIPFGVAPLARYHWTIIGRMLAHKPFFIWDNGENNCTLMHSKDFAFNFVQLMGNPKAFNQDVNLVGDEVHTWNEVLDIIYNSIPAEKNVVKIPARRLSELLPDYSEYIIGDRSLNAVFDNTKLKLTISCFKQNLSLSDGIKRTIDYYKSNGYLNGIDYRYDGQIDRMLVKSGYIDRSQLKSLVFMDYLGNATFKDRLIYYAYRYLNDYYRHYLLVFINKVIKR